jgi:Tol biopolymer transport system component
MDNAGPAEQDSGVPRRGGQGVRAGIISSSITLAIVTLGPPPTASASSSHATAFARNLHGQAEIYVMAPDGSNQTRLTYRRGWDEAPEWSPDGSRIAFDETNSALSDPANGIFVMMADGSGLTRLTRNRTGSDQAPTWSPDGTQIAFAAIRGDESDIYVVDADGSNLTQLTHDPATDTDPEWSPDGTKIVYASIRVNSNHPDIFVMNAGGTNRVRLTRNKSSDINPAWSPDGSAIAFASDRHGSYDLYVIGVDGASLRRITTTSAVYEREPTLSPNGQRLAFDRYRLVGAVLSDIYTVRLGTGILSRLTDTHPANFSPSWN